MEEVVIVAALRTAVGKFGGGIAKVPAVELGAQVIKALIAKTGIAPANISEVLMGQVLTAGCGQNPARQAALRAGLPDTVPAMTVGKRLKIDVAVLDILMQSAGFALHEHIPALG